MEFGLDKCATLAMYRGNMQKTEGIRLPNNSMIRSLELHEGYKYLGVLQADNIKHGEVKEQAKQEYLKRVRKALKSKLNAGNVIQAINGWAIPVLRYTAGIVDWTSAELDDIDRKTRKMMTSNGALHPQSDIDRLYIPRSVGGRGMQSVKQVMLEEQMKLAEYVQNSTEDALRDVWNEGLLAKQEAKAEMKHVKDEDRLESWKTKALHGKYPREIQDQVDEKETWRWLTNGHLNKQTESLIIAAQDQALRTNAIKARIDKTAESSICRLCKTKDETVDHIVSGCSKIAHTDYLHRHNRVASMIHWNLCHKYKIPTAKNWWQHKPEKVVENDNAKILWDFKIQTDKHLTHNTPDITVVENKQVWLIDVAIPGDSRLEQKENEKVTNYHDLRVELQSLWKKKATVVPIVVGALGAIPKDLNSNLEKIGVKKIAAEQLQKEALLGTAQILRKYLQNS